MTAPDEFLDRPVLRPFTPHHGARLTVVADPGDPGDKSEIEARDREDDDLDDGIPGFDDHADLSGVRLRVIKTLHRLGELRAPSQVGVRRAMSYVAGTAVTLALVPTLTGQPFAVLALASSGWHHGGGGTTRSANHTHEYQHRDYAAPAPAGHRPPQTVSWPGDSTSPAPQPAPAASPTSPTADVSVTSSFAGAPFDDSTVARAVAATTAPSAPSALAAPASASTASATTATTAPVTAPVTGVLPLVVTGPAPSATSGSTAVSGSTAAARMYGASRSGLPWFSGFWTGGYESAAHVAAAEQWRGTPMDFVTTYPAYATWDELASDSFAISTFDGFAGRLAYGLPLLPQDRRAQWSDVTSGAHDAVFSGLADQLVAHGRGDSVIRVGLEANGDWFPWGATAGTSGDFKAAFRRVVTVMRARAPHLTFWFDTSAGTALHGSSNRLDALIVLYPGDDVVDGISMDHFDFYQLVAKDDAAFASAMRPSSGPGLADAADFARAHGKGFAVPEWGLHSVQGPGDNPFFLRSMFGFFQANKDVLVFEDYFNEPDPYIANALFDAGNNAQSAAVYRSLWGRP